jgi:pimeloyl-ACP methyl ester carboxylesterase
VLRLTWTGEIAREAGAFRQGQKLTAHIAQFIETRGERIARIETFDCYEPFGSTRTAVEGSHAGQVPSADGVPIVYQRTGSATTALVFVHGWLGCSRWWDAQRDAFSSRFTVVQLDLAGHGGSGRGRTGHSAEAYAGDIAAVVSAIDARRVVLVGHSMSGAYALLAALSLPRAAALLLVDTLKNVEQLLPTAQVDELLALYRRDFPFAVDRMLPQRLFAPGTPPEVSARLRREFLERTGEEGAALLEPLYRFDVRAAAEQLKLPVRAVNSDLQPTDVEANRRHFRDYAVRLVPGVGHYPMLEAPAAFNAALDETLAELQLHP